MCFFLHLGLVFHYLVANLVLQLKGLAVLDQLCYCSRVAVRYVPFLTLKWFVLWSGSITCALYTLRYEPRHLISNNVAF